MEEAVAQLVGGEGEAAAAAAAALQAAVKARSLDVLGLVGLLKRPLTDEHDHEARARAVQLLSQVAVDAPEALLPGDVAVMAEFLGSKLQDWRCVGAAVPGCAALLARHTRPGLAQLPQPAALALITKVTGVHVQGLDHVGRKASYQLLLEVLQGPFAVPAALAGTDLVNYTVVAVENEVDFLCLLPALQCVQAVGRLYQAAALAAARHLTDGLEDLFDVCVAPYFPLMFTPPKNNPGRISRPQLLGLVIGAMACCPQFAPLAVPLLSEKLGSSLQQAKADVLQALPVCVEAWGPAAVKPHLQAVWLMLKAELMAPAAEGLPAEAVAARQATASAAAAALGRCVAALGPGLLDRQVLADVAVEDLQQYLGLVNPPWAQQQQQQQQAAGGVAAGAAAAGGSSTGWDLPQHAQRRLACIAGAVAAVAAASGPSCDAVVAELLRPALAAVLQDGGSVGVRPLQANCGVLCLLHAVASAVEAAPAPAAAAASLAQLVPDTVAVLQQLQARLQQQQPAAELLQAEQLRVWLLLVWCDLLTLHARAPCLQQQCVDAASQLLLQQALHGSADAVLLPPGMECSMQGASLAALRQLAQLQGQQQQSAPAALASMLQSFASPPLLQLLQQQPGSGSDAAQQQQLATRAVQLLQQLAGSSSAAAWQVMMWLQPTVLQQVRDNQAGLGHCLAIVQAHCLPALPAELPPQQSAEAARSCAALLEAWQQCWQQQHQRQQQGGHAAAADSSSTDSEVTSSMFVAQLLAKCRAEDQQQLMLTGCEWAVAAAAAQTQQGSGPAGFAAAVLAAVRPGLLTASSILDLAAALAHLSTSAWPTDADVSGSHSSSSSSDSHQWASLASGVALAGIVNKVISHHSKQAAQAGVSADALLAAVQPPLLAPLQQLQQQADGPAAVAATGAEQQQTARAALGAVRALAWLARALAMQRHESWLQCMHPALALLSVLPAAGCDPLQQQLLWAAAEACAVLVASGDAAVPGSGAGTSAASAGRDAEQQQVQLSAGQLGLQLSLHVAGRLLWQQRAFTMMLQSLLGATAAAGADAGAKQQQQEEAGVGPWLAAACLLSAAPAAVVDAENAQVLPLLLQCLARLRGLWAAGGAGGGPRLLQLLQACLGMVGQALLAGGEHCEVLGKDAEALLTVLCGLARLLPPPPADAAGAERAAAQQRQRLLLAAACVQEAALACLAACISGLPYHLLHPHKRRVLAVVADALDDDRRAVRRAAVAARASWTGGP